MPRAPKDPSVRARRNVTSTKAVLRPDTSVSAPVLPAREWSVMTTAWWADVWASPMAPEFDGSDVHGLFALAVLVDDFWLAESPSLRSKLAGEIRQQSQRFGLSPIDRRRLQWEIDRGSAAAERTKGRQPVAPAKLRSVGDPRKVLHL